MCDIIYRYINWNDTGSKRLLSANEFFFYSAEKWKNDGEYDFELLGFTREKVADIVLDIAIDMHNTDFKQYELWMNVQAQKYGIDLHRLLPAELDLADQHFADQIAKERVSNPERFIEGQRQLYFERTGIISFSKTKYSCNLWTSKRTAISDNVICVGLNLEKIKARLIKEANCIMSDVIYSDDLHKYELFFDKSGYKSMLQLLKVSFALKTQYKLEDEIRIQRLFVDNTAESEERRIILPNDVFEEVIISKEADEVSCAEIMKLVDEKGIKKIGFVKIMSDESTVFVDYS
jgi:hypothetical protein